MRTSLIIFIIIFLSGCSIKNSTSKTEIKIEHKEKYLYYACKNIKGNYVPLKVPNAGNVDEKLKKFTKDNNLNYSSCYSSEIYKK